jgi:hypothetical protein
VVTTDFDYLDRRINRQGQRQVPLTASQRDEAKGNK